MNLCIIGTGYVGLVTGPGGRPTPGVWLELPGGVGVVVVPVALHDLWTTSRDFASLAIGHHPAPSARPGITAASAIGIDRCSLGSRSHPVMVAGRPRKSLECNPEMLRSSPDICDSGE